MKYKKAVLITALLFGVLTLFKSPGDPDFGWHYKYGEYLVKHGRILRDNIFSYTFTDYKWANSYLISQAVMYVTHHYLGRLIAGLILAILLSLASILYMRALAKKAQAGLIVTTLITLMLFLELSGSGVTGRPMFFSSLFLMLLCATFLWVDGRDGYKKLWSLPGLFLMWANTHADFVLGLFIFGLYVVDSWLVPLVAKCFEERSLRRQANSVHLDQLAQPHTATGTGFKSVGRGSEVLKNTLPFVLIASILITLINPFGIQLWTTLVKESHPYQFSHISEWVPVSTENAYYFAVYCGVLGLITSAVVGARQKLPLWYVLATGMFCILAVRSQYFLRIAVILGAYAILVFWTPYLRDILAVLSSRVVKKVRLGFLAFLSLSTLVAGAIFATEVRESTDDVYWLKEHGYPKEALDYTLSHNIAGKVFNYYGWGGYMIWQYPQIITFIDGRMPSWREGDASVFEDYINIVDKPTQYLKLLDDYDVAWILYPSESKFVTHLTSGKIWQKVYSDDIATIFTRKF